MSSIYTPEQVLTAATRMLMQPILRLLQDDPHHWSTRPYETCRLVTALAGEPFGCYLVRAQKEAARGTHTR